MGECMKVMIVGSGGREHALVWKVAQSGRVSKIFCAPGNAGISEIAKCVDIKADDVPALANFAKQNRINLTIVGPEAPLMNGIVDSFKRLGLKIFGPSKEAALLEGSKAFAKAFCRLHNIPSAISETFTDPDLAKTYAKARALPVVVKADGLASGKGVIVCHSYDETISAIDRMLISREFGAAGAKIVIEEFLEGEEASFIAICDGNHVLPLASSQDHKAAFDGDVGPNTGGMGAISPAAIVTEDVTKTVMEKIMLPAARGMVTDGRPFVGVLYVGLMIRKGVAKVLEFNVRFGDPETQPLMMRLKTDLIDILEAAVNGELHQISLEWDPRPAVCVVMASGGYPGLYEEGKVIRGLDGVVNIPNVTVFHAGTRRYGDDVITDGGRVLGVTALGLDVRDAIRQVYATVEKISWDGMQYRKDIGHRAIRGMYGV